MIFRLDREPKAKPGRPVLALDPLGTAAEARRGAHVEVVPARDGSTIDLEAPTVEVPDVVERGPANEDELTIQKRDRRSLVVHRARRMAHADERGERRHEELLDGALALEARHARERVGAAALERADQPLGGSPIPPADKVDAVHETPMSDVMWRINKSSQNHQPQVSLLRTRRCCMSRLKVSLTCINLAHYRGQRATKSSFPPVKRRCDYRVPAQ